MTALGFDFESLAAQSASFLRRKTFKINPAAVIEHLHYSFVACGWEARWRKIIARERGRIEPKKQYSFLKLEPTAAGYQLHRNEIVFSAR